MFSKSVFISHAVANKELADKLVDLFETGVGFTDSEIFCSSLEGIGIPSGKNFVEFIKDQIKDPKVVVLLLTKDYLKSQFCLCELGASWVLSHNLIPLIVPPLEYKDMKAVLTGVQALKILDKSDLNEMQEELITALGIKGKPFAKWEVKRDKFLKETAEYLKQLPPEKNVTAEEFLKLKTDYKEALEELKSSEEQLDETSALVEKLKSLKDSEEVKTVVYENMDEIEQFELLAEKAKDTLIELPEIVTEAIYYHYRGESLEMPGLGDDYKRDCIKYAIECDYLTEAGESIEIVEDDPKISSALEALNELESFIREIESESEEFCSFYTDKYDHRLKFKSKRFWDTHLL